MGLCIISWLFSLLFCFSWGYTYFDVVDRYIAVYLMFILGIGECFGAAWMFGRAELMEKGDGDEQVPIMVLSLTYWIDLLLMGPITIFVLGKEGPLGISSIYGVAIFWLILLIGIIASFLLMKKKDFWHWY